MVYTVGMLSEVKCARCDRRYSGLRSRCPYCGARRIGRGKYSGENDSSVGKMLIAILILVVLIAAVIVLLVSGPDTEPEADVTDSVTPPASTIPDDGSNIDIEGPSYEPPDETPSETPSETPAPIVVVDSVAITYSGVKKTDITMKTNDPQLPMAVKIEPADVELADKIEWSSSNNGVFEVVPDDPSGTKVKVTAIGVGTATLTVKIGDVTAECIVRVIRS